MNSYLNKKMSRLLYARSNQKLSQLIADAKLLFGIYKYQLAEEGDGVVLKLGKKGILGGFILAEGHHKVFGAEGYEDVGICLYDFRRGINAPKSDVGFPRFLHDFESGRDSSDISDLCMMSKHCADGEATDRELTQLIRLAKKYEGKFTKIWDCGERCTINYPPAN